MKVLYSQLKKYLPNLTADVKEVANVFTITGFMLDKLQEVQYNGQSDYLLDLEVRQNRADLFGVWGLARELSAYYKIPLKYPEYNLTHLPHEYQLPITVKDKNAVKRVMAVKLTDVEVKESPAWLKEYLSLYEINSVNNLVDLTNYVMIETAHASHVFDADLVGDSLIWEINNGQYKTMTTLNGQEIELPEDALIITDGKRPLSLSFIGGQEDAVSSSTTNVILEMAIYNGTLVRKNAKAAKIVTEAGSRLEKALDPQSIPHAFDWLVSLIIEHCGGQLVSNVFNEYNQITQEITIDVDLDKVQQVAGIEISYEESKTYLINLGFTILNDLGNKITVQRPVNRLDIEIEQDVFEEIIRMKGFNKIPSNYLTTQVVKDITPSRIYLIDNVTEYLASIGLDEVRSWVLVDQETNKLANSLKWDLIKVTNSINEEVPTLRQSIAVSLLGQMTTYKKNYITPIALFEIGKVFGKKDHAYTEFSSLAILEEGNDINSTKLKIESLLRHLGLERIEYTLENEPPLSAHPKTAWRIIANTKQIGIIYLTNIHHFDLAVVAEINLDLVDELTSKLEATSSKEVTQKIVSLDSNIMLPASENITSFVLKKLEAITDNLWSWEIIDEYKNENNVKYTVRVNYVNLTDPEAKQLHSTLFTE